MFDHALTTSQFDFPMSGDVMSSGVAAFSLASSSSVSYTEKWDVDS
jgi:hypothetical protein